MQQQGFHRSHPGRKLRPDSIAGLVALAVIIVLWAMSIKQIRTPIMVAAGLITQTHTPTITHTPTVTPTPTITPTLMAITLNSEPFAEDETGVVLAAFSYDVSEPPTIQKTLYHSLTAHGLDVLRLDQPIPDESQAELIGRQYRASAVLWGLDYGEAKYMYLYIVPDIMAPEMLEKGNEARWFMISSDDTEYLVNFVAGLIAYKRDDPVTAIDFWGKAVELAEAAHYERDDSAEDSNYDRRLDLLYFYRGMTYFYLNQYEEAIHDLTIALVFDPEDKVALNNRGIAYHELEQYDEAMADYNASIRLDASYYLPYYNRGLAYSDMFNNQAALADLNRSAELNPHYDPVFWLRGNLHYRMDNHGAAAADYLRYEQLTGELEPHMAERLSEMGLR